MALGFVFYVESPRSDDLLDGRTEGKPLVESLLLAEIPVECNLAVSEEAFRACLDQRLVAAWKKYGGDNRSPILHPSCHGNRNGI